MDVTEITRRNIVDELRLNNITWFGRLSETEFLNRLYPIETLPSTDGRFENMIGDIWQHRINNLDWDEWWVFSDDRLELLKDDKRFLDFCAEMLHPLVRANEDEVNKLLEILNSHLAADGYKLVEKNRISGKPMYVAVSSDAGVNVENQDKISNEYVVEQLKKCEDKIGRGDYDGAISSTRSLVEGVIADIYFRITGEKLDKGNDLVSDYKKIKGLLNLSEEQYSNDSIKNIVRCLVGLTSGLDALSNQMGDRHKRPVKPQKHHAKLCVNSAKTFTQFLYDTMEFRFKGRESLYDEAIILVDNENRFLEREKLLNLKEVETFLTRTDPYLRSLLKNRFIEEFEINHFRQSDIFFAVLHILSDQLRRADIETIFKKHKDNPQACGLNSFLIELEKFNPDLLNPELLKYVQEVKKQFEIEE
jgi:hypothetical protein